ncbi:M48 family metallopeptidase [Chloroflexota bacterium]
MIQIDRIERSRRKTIAILIEEDGSLVIRAPKRTTNAQIKKLVQDKSDWIRKKQDQVKLQYQESQPKRYVDGEKFLFLGKTYPLTIVKGVEPSLVLNKRFYLSAPGTKNGEPLFTAWYKKRAREIIPARVELYASKFRLHYERVRITSAKKRWGSCSSAGNLNFSWRLVMAPIPVIDYVVIHELAHLINKNHSKAYWGTVKRMMPDYKQYVIWLKENGHRLTL